MSENIEQTVREKYREYFYPHWRKAFLKAVNDHGPLEEKHVDDLAAYVEEQCVQSTMGAFEAFERSANSPKAIADLVKSVVDATGARPDQINIEIRGQKVQF